MTIAIIGAGLAGTAAAYCLKQAGLSPVLYEAGEAIAPGASGNAIGLVNPRFAAFRTPQSDYFVSAFTGAVSLFSQIEGIDWRKCGSVHLMNDEKKERRFPQTLENWNWSEDEMQLLSAEEASAVSGVTVEHEALYLPSAGYVSPKKLCAYYAQGIETQLGSAIQSLDEIDAEIIILACGKALKDLGYDLPIKPVRGQVTEIKATQASANLKTDLCYGGYCAPAINGIHTIGATFQRWLDHSEIMPEDDQYNLKKLQQAAPGMFEGAEIIGHRASVRAASKDHFPIVGCLDEEKRIYVSAAHGSHGIISSLAAGTLLTDLITKRPYSLSQFTVNALSPQRFKGTNSIND